jgi:esterase/lipase
MAVEESVFNSKKDMPLILRITKKLYPILEKLLTKQAHIWAVDKFSTPFHFPPKSKELGLLDSAELYSHSYKAQDVQVYEWNRGSDKSVLLSHGWSGRGGQFWALIPQLVNAGFHVVTYDALAHGRSAGKKTHLWDFQKIIEQLSIRNKGFHYIIGHSLGGVAGALALKNRAKAKGLITINSPSISKEMIESFVSTINGSESLVKYFRTYIEDNFGVTLEEYELLNVVPQLLKAEIEVSIIADKDDRDVPFRHSEVLKSQNPSIDSFFTQGYGHNKLLGNQEMIDFVLAKLI